MGMQFADRYCLARLSFRALPSRLHLLSWLYTHVFPRPRKQATPRRPKRIKTPANVQIRQESHYLCRIGRISWKKCSFCWKMYKNGKNVKKCWKCKLSVKMPQRACGDLRGPAGTTAGTVRGPAGTCGDPLRPAPNVTNVTKSLKNAEKCQISSKTWKISKKCCVRWFLVSE